MSPSVHSSGSRRSKSPGRDGEKTPVPAAPAGPPAGRPAEDPYTHGFFDNDAGSAGARKAFIGATIGNTVMIMVMIWGILAIYWGSAWKGRNGAHNLEGWIIDFDGGQVGQFVTQSFMNATGPKDAMSWYVKPASDFPSGTSELANMVHNEKAWAIVAINAGASDKLSAALASADATYVGTSAVSAYAVQARNENAYRDLIAPNIQANMLHAGQIFATEQARRVATSTSLATLLSGAPQILLQPVSYSLTNVRPFDVPVATAVDFVGLIYLVIISFNVVMGGVGIRMQTGMERRLTLRSYISLRLVVPIVSYFFLSLAFALLSKFFLVPFDRKFGPGGFIVYWMLSYFAMLCLGLALESVMTLITQRFIAFFLILWIIINVSVCFYPVEILPTFYRYGYGVPFYSINTAVRTIIFGTKNKLGQNFGILLAWIVISLISLPLFAFIVRRHDVAAWRRTRPTPGPVEDGRSEKEAVRSEESRA